MPSNDASQSDIQETPEVQRPAWATWALIAWITATAAIYYYNFSTTFYESNQSAIQALLDRLF